jgi:methanogenic corrinoid protein MtbC1
MIAKLEALGLCYETLVDEVFAPAARKLGQKWNTNDLSFSEVSTGISTLLLVNAILRSQTAPVAAGSRNHVLFVTLPHQAHTLGIILAAETFRRRQCEVDMMLNATTDSLVDYVSESQVGLIGMTAGREDSIEAIFSLCDRLSKLPRPPVVLLGGAAAQAGRGKYPESCIRVDNVENALRHAERINRR